MNGVWFLRLLTTARRNSSYSNPFPEVKAKAVTGREEGKGWLDTESPDESEGEKRA
jgi:hypothetical protein